MNRDELIESAAGAYRHRSLDGAIAASPAWHDLDDEGRLEAHDRATALRQLEAALRHDAHSTTVAAVLARIGG